MERYFDKHGVEITSGMHIRHENDIKEVLVFGDYDLGIEYNEHHCDALSALDTSHEWEIVNDGV
jgi:hypothetical protein